MREFSAIYDVTDFYPSIQKFLNIDPVNVAAIKMTIRNIVTNEDEKISIRAFHDLAEEQEDDEEDDELTVAPIEFQHRILSSILYQYITRIQQNISNPELLHDMISDFWITTSPTMHSALEYYAKMHDIEEMTLEPIGSILITLEREDHAFGYAVINFIKVDDRLLMMQYYRNKELVIRNQTTMFLSTGRDITPRDYSRTFLAVISTLTGVPNDAEPILIQQLTDYRVTNPNIADAIKFTYAMHMPEKKDDVRLYRQLKEAGIDLFSKDEVTIPDAITGHFYFNPDILLEEIDDYIANNAFESLFDDDGSDFIIDLELAFEQYNQHRFEITPQVITMKPATGEVIHLDATLDNPIANYMGLYDLKFDELSKWNRVEFFDLIYSTLVEKFGRLSFLADKYDLPLEEDEVVFVEAPFGKIEISDRFSLSFYLIQMPIFLTLLAADQDNIFNTAEALMDKEHYGADGVLTDITSVIANELAARLKSEKMTM